MVNGVDVVGAWKPEDRLEGSSTSRLVPSEGGPGAFTGSFGEGLLAFLRDWDSLERVNLFCLYVKTASAEDQRPQWLLNHAQKGPRLLEPRAYVCKLAGGGGDPANNGCLTLASLEEVRDRICNDLEQLQVLPRRAAGRLDVDF